MKKIYLRILLILITILLVGCNRNDNNQTLYFWGWGDQDEIPIFNEMVDKFNQTIGKESGMTVEYRPVSTEGYTTLIEQTLSGRRGPDVFFVEDKYFKKWTRLGFLEPLDEFMKTSTLDLDDMWASAISRYRYNIENNTSNESDKLYGLPKDVSSTAIYYNKTAFENVGIILISVDEKDITEDYVNKFNLEHQTFLTVGDLKKGFYREYPYYYYSGISWMKPVENEVMVFNNRIPMSWDEVEDLAMIMTKSYNLSSPTTYGYYTEWWFNYAFSVGGDCIEDKTGNGDWTFTLGDDTPNYLVNEPLIINSNNYLPGQFVGYSDKSYLLNSSETNTLIKDNKISELPSTREAFTRFVMLGQSVNDGGLAIAPTTSTVMAYGKPGFFSAGNVAMLVDYTYRIVGLRRLIMDSFDWDVAPLPIYKVYENDQTTVKSQGSRASHSSSSAFAIWSKSTKKDFAFKFIEYMTGPNAQEIQANSGFNLPNQKSIAYSDVYLKANQKPQNIRVFAEAAEIQTPGDWWYMPDRTWITEWATALNSSVRNGKMTLDEFFDKYIDVANDALLRYK